MKLPIPDEIKVQLDETSTTMKQMNQSLIEVKELLQQILDVLSQP
jgi:hypothetical protein